MQCVLCAPHTCWFTSLYCLMLCTILLFTSFKERKEGSNYGSLGHTSFRCFPVAFSWIQRVNLR